MARADNFSIKQQQLYNVPLAAGAFTSHFFKFYIFELSRRIFRTAKATHFKFDTLTDQDQLDLGARAEAAKVQPKNV